MQPYFCPYFGYFQLVNAVDLFVFYDDVTFIKGGWVNRNYIYSNGKKQRFTIPVKGHSSSRLIKDTEVDWSQNKIKKFIKTLHQSYGNSPYKQEVLPMIEDLIKQQPGTISELAIESVKRICDFLGIKTRFKISSQENYVKTDDKTQNLIRICQRENANHYINPVGGTSLYSKKEFAEHGIQLNFIDTLNGASVIDELMRWSTEEINKKLDRYQLV